MRRAAPAERIAVIAGSRPEALDYIRRSGLRPRDLYYIGRHDHLDGLEGVVCLVGRYERSPAIRHARALAARGRLQLVEVQA
jgi:hypothetical protein